MSVATLRALRRRRTERTAPAPAALKVTLAAASPGVAACCSSAARSSGVSRTHAANGARSPGGSGCSANAAADGDAMARAPPGGQRAGGVAAPELERNSGSLFTTERRSIARDRASAACDVTVTARGASYEQPGRDASARARYARPSDEVRTLAALAGVHARCSRPAAQYHGAEACAVPALQRPTERSCAAAASLACRAAPRCRAARLRRQLRRREVHRPLRSRRAAEGRQGAFDAGAAKARR